jgi:hypothetical protein
MVKMTMAFLKKSLFFRVAVLEPDPHYFGKLDPDPDPL